MRPWQKYKSTHTHRLTASRNAWQVESIGAGRMPFGASATILLLGVLILGLFVGPMGAAADSHQKPPPGVASAYIDTSPERVREAFEAHGVDVLRAAGVGEGKELLKNC